MSRPCPPLPAPHRPAPPRRAHRGSAPPGIWRAARPSAWRSPCAPSSASSAQAACACCPEACRPPAKRRSRGSRQSWGTPA
eukprot:scaffold28030_cov72-Phaeocystis_antarctica.AAC.13